MANEKLGRDVQFSFDTNVIGDVRTADLSVEGSTVEIINDSSGEWTEKILARKDWNLSLSVDLTEHDTASNQSAIIEKLLTGNAEGTIELGPETPVEGDVIYTGDVIVTTFNIQKETDSVLTADIEIEGNGQLVRSVEPAPV